LVIMSLLFKNKKTGVKESAEPKEGIVVVVKRTGPKPREKKGK